MEQLIWAIIMVIFIIIAALKNRARNKPRTTSEKARGEDDKISRYMEELLGIERPVPAPKVEVKKQKPKPERLVKERQKAESWEKTDPFESSSTKKYEDEQKAVSHEKKDIYQAKFPWNNLSKDDLPNAIILSEIIGPPISKRKGHRLF